MVKTVDTESMNPPAPVICLTGRMMMMARIGIR